MHKIKDYSLLCHVLYSYIFAKIDSCCCVRDRDEVLRLGGDAEDLLLAALGFLEVRPRHESRENLRLHQPSQRPGEPLDTERSQRPGGVHALPPSQGAR
jgi:hypothetical protein